jgi:hypothetical protein
MHLSNCPRLILILVVVCSIYCAFVKGASVGSKSVSNQFLSIYKNPKCQSSDWSHTFLSSVGNIDTKDETKGYFSYQGL